MLTAGLTNQKLLSKCVSKMKIALIPGTQGFTISTTGEVFDAYGRVRNQYTNGDGYKTVSVKLTDGRFVTFGVHRLVALTHIPNNRLDRTEVNHRDGDITNNSVENLEWVTPRENNIHSELLCDDVAKQKLIIYKEGIPHDLACNLKRASRLTGISYLEVWDHLKDNLISKEGYSFEYVKYSENVPKELRQRTKSDGVAKAVKSKNVDTGEILYFDNFRQAAEYFETTKSAVSQAVQKDHRPKLLQQKYQIAHAEKDFPVLSEEDILVATSRGPKRVYAIDVSSKEEHTFVSASEFVKQSGLSKKAVTMALRGNTVRRLGKWLFTYEDSANVVRIKDLVLSPVNI